MRFLSIFLLFLLNTCIYTVAQPVKNLSGAVIDTRQTPANEQITIADFAARNKGGITSRFLQAERTKPGVAFLSSAIVPGSAQAANQKWVRAGIYALAEAATVFYYFNRHNLATRQERRYEHYANTNWSVVAYAQWLVNYSIEHNIDNNYQQLAANIAGTSPDFTNTTRDWLKVNIAILQQVERNTPYIFENKTTSNFSHNLPDYGSQQYYELISKYWQFQSGWKDVYTDPTINPNYPFYKWDGSDASPNFYEGRDRAAEFNNNYRLAGNILSVILINHVISAFDGLMTVKLHNSRLNSQASVFQIDSFSVTFDF